jgi:redox-regulated HSP33 family molecular chaperone
MGRQHECMRKLRAVTIAGVLALTAALASAADLNGKWTAQMQGRDGQSHEISFNFAVNGDQLTGTMTTPRGDTDITDGKVEGDQISFNQTMTFGDREVKITYKGTVSTDGNSIEFTRTFNRPSGGDGSGGGENREGRRGGRGGGMNRTFTAKRATT